MNTYDIEFGECYHNKQGLGEWVGAEEALELEQQRNKLLDLLEKISTLDGLPEYYETIFEEAEELVKAIKTSKNYERQNHKTPI